jgi:hypothetical protein
VKPSDAQFHGFVLPHLTRGHHGPVPGFPLGKIFNYILKVLFLGGQWNALSIERNPASCAEIHPTSVCRTTQFGMQTE